MDSIWKNTAFCRLLISITMTGNALPICLLHFVLASHCHLMLRMDSIYIFGIQGSFLMRSPVINWKSAVTKGRLCSDKTIYQD